MSAAFLLTIKCLYHFCIVVYSTISKSALINESIYLNLPEIRKNLESRYNSLEVSATISNFEKYIEEFISLTDYTITKKVIYPATGKYGSNVLDTVTSHFKADHTINHSLGAELPQGVNIRIKFINKSSTLNKNLWFYTMFQHTNLSISLYDEKTGIQEFTSIESGKPIDCCFSFGGTGSATIEIYENGKITPSRIKNITWG